MFGRTTVSVILTRGHDVGLLPLTYVTQVTKRRTGAAVWSKSSNTAATAAGSPVPAAVLTPTPSPSTPCGGNGKKRRSNDAKRGSKRRRRIGHTTTTTTTTVVVPVDPAKRAKKNNIISKRIDELKKREATDLNGDQKKKLRTEEGLRKELESLGS